MWRITLADWETAAAGARGDDGLTTGCLTGEEVIGEEDDRGVKVGDKEGDNGTAAFFPRRLHWAGFAAVKVDFFFEDLAADLVEEVERKSIGVCKSKLKLIFEVRFDLGAAGGWFEG